MAGIMADYLTEALNMATGGAWADAQLVTESDKLKAKKLLKRFADDKTPAGRGARAYLRATASGRDADYLLDQKGAEGDGARKAAKALKEGKTETIRRAPMDFKNWKAAMKFMRRLREPAFPKKNKDGSYTVYFGKEAEKMHAAKRAGVDEDEVYVDPADALYEMECDELDAWWTETRSKLIRGSKSTRGSRLNGCYSKLTTRMARTGGIKVSGQSQTHLNPVPKRERDKEDQPDDGTPGELPKGVETNEDRFASPMRDPLRSAEWDPAWDLDESEKMSQAEMARVFEKLKPKMTVMVAMHSVSGRHPKMDRQYHEWKVGRRSVSKRVGLESVTLLPMEGAAPKGARMNRIQLYRYTRSSSDGSIGAAWGDMAVMLDGLKLPSRTEGYEGSKKYKGKRLPPADDEEGEFDTASGGTSSGPAKKIKVESRRIGASILRQR